MNKTITLQEWNESQAKEAAFWAGQALADNPEQFHRWGWYRDVCFPDWFRYRRFDGLKVADVGSGPGGILHYVGKADLKVAVDPLMDRFAEQYGASLTRNDVQVYDAPAECLCPVIARHGLFDVVFCLNCLDHCQDPQACINQLSHMLYVGGELVLCVDMRRAEDLDALHKIQITAQFMMDALRNASFDFDCWLIPHQAPTKTVQFCAVATKL